MLVYIEGEKRPVGFLTGVNGARPGSSVSFLEQISLEDILAFEDDITMSMTPVKTIRLIVEDVEMSRFQPAITLGTMTFDPLSQHGRVTLIREILRSAQVDPDALLGAFRLDWFNFRMSEDIANLLIETRIRMNATRVSPDLYAEIFDRDDFTPL